MPSPPIAGPPRSNRIPSGKNLSEFLAVLPDAPGNGQVGYGWEVRKQLEIIWESFDESLGSLSLGYRGFDG
jgi:hypothetical protein